MNSEPKSKFKTFALAIFLQALAMLKQKALTDFCTRLYKYCIGVPSRIRIIKIIKNKKKIEIENGIL